MPINAKAVPAPYSFELDEAYMIKDFCPGKNFYDPNGHSLAACRQQLRFWLSGKFSRQSSAAGYTRFVDLPLSRYFVRMERWRMTCTMRAASLTCDL
jgi:hypothetical protein